MDIEKTLAERGSRYGDFAEHAVIAQSIKENMWSTDGWNRLTPAMCQALEVIADKIARILNGDPTYADNWHDIIGYARLVEKTLAPEPAPAGVLNALHRTDTAGYANLAEVHPVRVEDQLPEHQLTEVEEYGFSDGIGRIMTRSEFDRAHGAGLRSQLEQAREARRLNRSQCNSTFKTTHTQD